MFSKEKEIICYNYNKRGHTSNKCPKKKNESSKKKIVYRNKKEKVNFFDLPSSYDELINSESESENDVNYGDEPSSLEGDICRDPYCIECKDFECSDPDVCNCNALRMMKTDDEETSRNLFAQMMAATDQQLKDMYKTLLMDHLKQVPSSVKNQPNKGYVPPATLYQ